jgi:nucleoside phosphorylase
MPMNPTHIIFCAAVPLEVKSLCQSLSIPIPTAEDPISHGKYKSLNITVLVSGVGIDRMMKRLQQVQPMTCSCWVSYGFAGALSPKCTLGEVYSGKTVQYLHHEEHHAINLNGLEFEEKNTLLCNGVLVSTPKEKSELHQQSKAELVDMESYAVAVMAHQRHEPFFWIRGISDGYDEPLPVDLLHCLDQNGFPSVWQSAIKIVKKPTLLPQALKLGKITQLLQKNLASNTVQILEKVI